MTEVSSFKFQDYFCHVCGNLLALGQSTFARQSGVSANRPFHHCCLLCQTKTKKGTRSDSSVPKRKFPDKSDIISEEASWANAAKADEKCPKCDHTRAYYLQVQTRSADEPMTTFYRCEKCSNTWKE